MQLSKHFMQGRVHFDFVFQHYSNKWDMQLTSMQLSRLHCSGLFHLGDLQQFVAVSTEKMTKLNIPRKF